MAGIESNYFIIYKLIIVQKIRPQIYYKVDKMQ